MKKQADLVEEIGMENLKIKEVTTIDKDRLQELEVIEDLFHKMCKWEKPLEKLWIEDNKDYLMKTYGTLDVVPDGKELIDWCVKTLKDLMYHKHTTVGLWAIDKDPKELIKIFNKLGYNEESVPFFQIEYKEIKK